MTEEIEGPAPCSPRLNILATLATMEVGTQLKLQGSHVTPFKFISSCTFEISPIHSRLCVPLWAEFL